MILEVSYPNLGKWEVDFVKIMHLDFCTIQLFVHVKIRGDRFMLSIQVMV